ncbi:MAG: MBL fold metallo-hydrolase [Acidimicrobiales bacterium]
MPTLHHADGQADIHKVVVGPLDNNVFVLQCRDTGDAVLIDAADEPERLLELSRSLGVGMVLETHGHRDHIQAVPALRHAGYPVGIAAADARMLADYDFVIEDGAVFEVGQLRLHAMATPGHTPGSTCFHLEGSPLLFSGDTLFPGGPGATGGDPDRFAAIITAIEDRLFTLAPDTVVLPGHGEDTTIGAEQPHLSEWKQRGW